ncbi:hypothetical protein SEA_SAMPSON_82 [Gordonia Phage Sampson]|uniref:Uncharacterized protein n=2 Tax=Zitchvirus TaxID=2948963 RepID=A0A976U9S4_9CAUD|nr:hypothetical protein SEA_SAMPSON_82 [Gordonia Phage Sampson]UVF61701.1 hypothetical protein SEA_APUNK_80 [Gordonia phage APunk]
MTELHPIASHNDYTVWESDNGTTRHITTPTGDIIDEAGMRALALVLAEIRCDEKCPIYGDPCDLPVGHDGNHFAAQVNGIDDPEWSTTP